MRLPFRVRKGSAPAHTRGAGAKAARLHPLTFGGFATKASHRTMESFGAGRPEVVGLCHPEWRGIRAATYGQVPHVLELEGCESRAQAEAIGDFLEGCGTRLLVINGFPPGSDLLAESLSMSHPSVTVQFVYHGSPALFHHGEDDVIERMLRLCDKKAVRKLGFVKKGFAEFFCQQGYPAEYVLNITDVPVRLMGAPLAGDGALHVGVFGTQTCHKNVEAQIAAALMLPGTIVHVGERPRIAYLERLQSRIVSHGLVGRDAFLDLLGQMHVNSYVSLVECYPMTVLESIAVGTPCLTSHTSDLFDDVPALFTELVVTRHDNVAAISRQLGRTLANREALLPLAQRHLQELNRRARVRWQEFVSA